ncbi:MAG: hypothetical protein U0359_08290 [Byssovorax sp.]
MNPGSVALVLIQPDAPLAVWSGASLVDRLRTALFHRYEDAYFRPIVQAETIAGLRWQVAKLRWLFAAETSTFGLGMFALEQLGWTRRLPRRDREEGYAYFQQRLATSGFSEETSASMDYVLYTALRLVSEHDVGAVSVSPKGTWRQLSDLLRASSTFYLYFGAIVLAVLEPGIVKNPLVLREIARDAVKVADAFIMAATSLGLISE